VFPLVFEHGTFLYQKYGSGIPILNPMRTS
jgi:hypothetical protein